MRKIEVKPMTVERMREMFDRARDVYQRNGAEDELEVHEHVVEIVERFLKDNGLGGEEQSA